jgi:hypothetical protein
LNRDDQGRKYELPEDEVPDVDVTTWVRAKELRFGIVPEVKIWFRGEPDFRASSRTERENLPDEGEPSVTYRDAEARWEARAKVLHPTDPPDLSDE